MCDSSQHICCLAADMVLATRKYTEAANAGADTAKVTADMRDRLVGLCGAFYAVEEAHAMDACFRTQGRGAPRGERDKSLPDGSECALYDLVARFIASLVPSAVALSSRDHVTAEIELLPGSEHDALSHALSESGYL